MNVHFTQFVQSLWAYFKPNANQVRKRTGIIDDEGKAGEALTRRRRQSPEDLNRGSVRGRDDGGWSIRRDCTDGIDIVFEIRAVAD